MGPSRPTVMDFAIMGHITILTATIHSAASSIAAYATASRASCRFDPTTSAFMIYTVRTFNEKKPLRNGFDPLLRHPASDSDDRKWAWAQIALAVMVVRCTACLYRPVMRLLSSVRLLYLNYTSASIHALINILLKLFGLF
ncbi:hypothetical protein RB195_000349 [Necator americanus]